jgi:hypothetical protein
LKSASLLITPVARNRLRCGARSKPDLTRSDLIITSIYYKLDTNFLPWVSPKLQVLVYFYFLQIWD